MVVCANGYDLCDSSFTLLELKGPCQKGTDPFLFAGTPTKHKPLSPKLSRSGEDDSVKILVGHDALKFEGDPSVFSSTKRVIGRNYQEARKVARV